jgi:hypothetical protein
VAWHLEAVEWEDVTSVSRFTLDHDFESERLFKLSVGFVIRETPEYIVLADDVDTSRRRDSPNNYGTIIPKGCIRSRQLIYGDMPGNEALSSPPEGRKAESGAGELIRRFLHRNPYVVATARDISLRVGIEQSEAQRQLTDLESAGEVRQALPGLWQAHQHNVRKAG